MPYRILLSVVAYSSLLATAGTAWATDPEQLLQTIKQVGPEGQGNVEAAEAVRELSTADAKVLPVILVGFDEANPLAANWIRSAFETIASRQLSQGDALPAVEMERFVLDQKQDPRARRLASEWLAKVDDTVADRLIPGMLLDPSAELRRDAVTRHIEQAQSYQKQKETAKAIAEYQLALKGATDEDQVKAIVEPLAKHGQEIDVPSHYGFVTTWQIVGPFDNTDKKGFDVAYPPEESIDLDKSFEGQKGEVKWVKVSTDHNRGIVDIAKELAPHKGAVMYAYAEFTGSQQQPIELRLGTPNAWKIWLNGELLFGRQEYHRGMKLDQYRVSATLQKGRNTILLKVCQNEQTDSWAQRYQFQLRVCEPSGIAVTPADGPKNVQNRAAASDSQIAGQ